MTNEEKLAKLREVESLVVQATDLMYEIKRSSASSGKDGRWDAESCADICNSLFRLVEPGVTSHPEYISIEEVNGDHAPRGSISCFRLRYEILCGIRKFAGGWSYPKV